MTPLYQPATSIPVFVINMEQDRDSWELVSQSVAIHGGNFNLHRVDALNARLVEPADYKDVDTNRFRRRNGRDMLPGEYGCYRSHLMALEAFLSDGAPYGIILEDDVLFNERTVSRVRSIIDTLPHFGAIKLINHRSRYLISLDKTLQGDEIGRTMHGPQGSAAAYLVSRDGARSLLENLSTMSLPWDVALERFWHNGTDVFSVLDDVLDFSPHRARSTIAAGGYDMGKYPWYRRFGTAAFRFKEIFVRAWHVMLSPNQIAAVPDRQGHDVAAIDLPGWGVVLAGLAVLIFVSAVWVETDAYRYAGLALIAATLVHYFRTDFWTYKKPLVGWAGLICIAWALYAGLRLGYVLLVHPDHGSGSAEGIYILPLLYPSLGYGLFLFIQRPFVLATVFMLISLVVVIFGIDYTPMLHGIRAWPYLQNNTIHAGISCGLIALCALPYTLHALRRSNLTIWQRSLAVSLGIVTFGAALYAVYATMARGAWLGMAISLPFLATISLLTESSRWSRRIAFLGGLAVALGAIFAWDAMEERATETITVANELLTVVVSDGLLDGMARIIDEAETPPSERERLMLWANSLHIWGEHPIFGAGISWLHYWAERPYQETTYNLLHNGYLEIAVRYGFVGLAFYGFLAIWIFVRIRQAVRAGLVDVAVLQCYSATMVFFAVSLLSNSNIRLAIGESYMWITAATGFYCYYLLQRRGLVRPNTAF